MSNVIINIPMPNKKTIAKKCAISLSLYSNTADIVDKIMSHSQKGTRLLSLAGIISGPRDMSTNKKKYL